MVSVQIESSSAIRKVIFDILADIPEQCARAVVTPQVLLTIANADGLLLGVHSKTPKDAEETDAEARQAYVDSLYLIWRHAITFAFAEISALMEHQDLLRASANFEELRRRERDFQIIWKDFADYDKAGFESERAIGELIGSTKRVAHEVSKLFVDYRQYLRGAPVSKWKIPLNLLLIFFALTFLAAQLYICSCGKLF